MPDGVIFDMDGVLVASGRAHAASWKLLARKHGMTITDAQFQASFGQTSREIIRTWWGEGVDAETTRTLDDEKERIYRDLVRGLVPLTIGVRETLWHLQQAGYILAVGTSGPQENIDLVLGETGMRGFFAATVNGHEVAQGKPAPDIFLAAADRIGVTPQRCVVVEDAPVGIAAALAAGMGVIGFVGTHPAESLTRAGVHAVAENMAEITPALVAEILG